MKRERSKRPNDLDLLPEYDFAAGVRGKYAQRYRQRGNVVTLDVEATEDVQIWAPLIDFSWAGSQREIAGDTWIRPASAYKSFDQFAYVLAEEERDRCRQIDHWLSIARGQRDKLSASEKINSFLLGLWIVRPTRTHVPFRFEESQSGTKPFVRMLDRFQWVKTGVASGVEDRHLAQVARILPILRTTHADRKRLSNALVLTLQGCMARQWQVAFVCFTAAAEAILTSSQERGLTDRLASTYAKLVTRNDASRKRASERFRRLYSVRSHIVHGRAYERRTPGRNLRDLAAFANRLRQLWSVVLASGEIRVALEGDDVQRQKFFLGL